MLSNFRLMIFLLIIVIVDETFVVCLNSMKLLAGK